MTWRFVVALPASLSFATAVVVEQRGGRCMSRAKAVTRRVALATLAFALSAGVAHAAPGDLDPSFGQGGRVGIVSGGAEYAVALAIQADGRIVVAGHSAANAVGEAVVYRLNPDGSLDRTFNGNGRLGIAGGGGDSATAVAVQRDGKILVAGYTFADNTVNAIVYRLNPNGSFDASFGNDGARRIVSSAGEGARALALQSDGKIIVAGDAAGDAVVYRLNPDGSSDQTFNGNGRLAIDGSDFANSVALQPDGRIVVAGRMTDAAGKSDAAIYRLDPDGSFDPTFNGNGRLGIDAGGFDEADVLALQPDGRIVVAGSTSVNAAAAVWRVAPNGSLDPSLDGDGALRLDDGADAFALGLALQPDGKIVVAGSTTVNDNGDPVVHRLNPDGSVDAGFGRAGKVGIDEGANEYAYAMALQTDGKVVVAGETSRGNDAVVYRLQGGGAPGAAPKAPAVAASRARAPVLAGLRISPRAFRAARSGPAVAPAARRGGALVSFGLDRAATVRLGVESASRGRRAGGRCVRPTSSNRGKRPCTRYSAVAGSFTHRGAAGANRLRFSGRVSARRLRPGRYRLVATPSTDGLRGDAARASFRVMR
jgi:uncharacterized delta-60 repeat protein